MGCQVPFFPLKPEEFRSLRLVQMGVQFQSKDLMLDFKGLTFVS